MPVEELLSRVALAFGIGLLIGLERGWHKREAPPGGRTAGVRTFAIAGLLGGIVAALGSNADGGLSIGGGIVLGAAFIAFAGVVTIFSRDENQATHSFSATTTIAALLTFMLGAYALLGDVRVTAASAIATTGILIIREELHGWVAKITLPEFESGLVLLAMTFIALPVVPDRAIGPFGGVNPHQIWIIAIVLAAVSFAGYVAVKLLGERRGVLLAAATGGLVSSTAVTLANARRAASGEGSQHVLAAGAALATAVSFIRVVAVVAVLKPLLLPLIAPALLVGAIAAGGFAFGTVYWRATPRNKHAMTEFRNPFGFWSVAAMAVSMGVLIVIGRLIYERFGAAGTIGSAAAMGLFDVDAMTVSITRLAPQPLDLSAASYAILAGVAANTLSKAAISVAVRRNSYALQIAMVSGICIVVGWLTMWLTLPTTG